MSKLKDIFQERILQTNSLVERTNKSSVLVIQQFPTEDDQDTLYPNVRESVSNIMAFIELGDVDTLKEVIEATDGVFDAIAMDSDMKCSFSPVLVEYAAENVKKSKLLWYSDMTTWADAGVNLVTCVENGVYKKNVLVTGEGTLAEKLKRRLAELGAHVNAGGEVDVVIGAAVKQNSFDAAQIALVKAKANVYDIGIGNFSGEDISQFKAKDCTLYRIDIRAGISSIVLGLFETDYLVNKVMGKVAIKGVKLVAGGILGDDGAVIIDDINHPTHIIGIADGKGYIKKGNLTSAENESLKFVAELINSK